jgi:hypothetical protein
MKEKKKIKNISCFLALLIFLLISKTLGEAVSLNWNGYLFLDNRANVNSPVEFSWNEYRLDIKGEVYAFGKTKFFGETWIRSLGFPSVNSITNLTNPSLLLSQNILLREAYVDLYGLAFENLDLRIGRQRISWGKGDRINPTDVLSPYDLEDVWDFGRRLGTDGIKASLYLRNVTLEAVYIPFFRPSVLPSGPMMSLFKTSVPNLPGTNQSINVYDTIEMPLLSPKESSSGGIKIGGRIPIIDIDASVSYAYFRDCLPIVKGIELNPKASSVQSLIEDAMDLNINIESAKATLIYPRLHMLGIDFAGAISKLGIWGEGAIFFPDRQYDMVTTIKRNEAIDTLMQMLSALPPSMTTQYESLINMANNGIQSPYLKKDPYIKLVLGIDYTFSWNMYLNLQYVHGFVHERGDSIQDYLMGNLDWNLLNNKLKLTPVGIGLEIKDFSNISKSYALVGQPQIAWYPLDNTEIILGARIIDGKEGTYFGKIKDQDEIYLKIKYSF